MCYKGRNRLRFKFCWNEECELDKSTREGKERHYCKQYCWYSRPAEHSTAERSSSYDTAEYSSTTSQADLCRVCPLSVFLSSALCQRMFSRSYGRFFEELLLSEVQVINLLHFNSFYHFYLKSLFLLYKLSSINFPSHFFFFLEHSLLVFFVFASV